MKILVVGDPHGRLPKKIPKKEDFIIITGDIGKADLARVRYFENVEREKKGLEKLENDSKFGKKVFDEVYNSTISILKKYSSIAPTYSIIGNVGTYMLKETEMKKEEKELGIKLPRLKKRIDRVKNFHLARNVVRNIGGLRIGFLEYFVDNCWIKEFGDKDKKRIKMAKKETEKAKKVLKGFGSLDILVCHQPPFGVLDKMLNRNGPKTWYGKNAGSKVILDYVKKYQPKYVFCGHMHESKGQKKIGKTEVHNIGFNGDYKMFDIK